MNNLYSGLIYDVLYGDLKYREPFVLSSHIKPAWNFTYTVFGKVFTCKGSPVRNEKSINDDVRLNMLSVIPRGCIMVYNTDVDYSVAHFGDITATIAKKAGCNGAIIDGCTRDLRAIQNLQFPVFCRKLSPIDSYTHWQIIDYQTTIYIPGEMGEVKITPNHYVFADETGIIVIPENLVEKVLEKANERLKKELKLKSMINNTENPNLISLYKRMGVH